VPGGLTFGLLQISSCCLFCVDFSADRRAVVMLVICPSVRPSVRLERMYCG